MKVYLFRPARSKLTHAVQTEHSPLGSFEIDQIFGGGMTIPCGRPAAGKGILSAGLKSWAYVTCKRCRRKLGIKAKPKEWICKAVRSPANERA